MRLIVAVDLDDLPEEVLAMGSAWAQKLGAMLDVLYVDEHVYNAALVTDPAILAALDQEWGRVHEHHRERLHELVAALPEAIRGEPVFSTGRAAEEIVAAAAGHDALLIATHGRRGLAHALLGSVAERVVRTAATPVLVLPLKR